MSLTTLPSSSMVLSKMPLFGPTTKTTLTHTIKSGYNWLLSLRNPIFTHNPLTHNPLHSWSWIFKFQLLKMIKFFFWLACHNSVPTISLLNNCKMSHSVTCIIRDIQDKSFLSLHWDGEFSRSLWNHIGFNNLYFFSNSGCHRFTDFPFPGWCLVVLEILQPDVSELRTMKHDP
jgi:hypothetical protein